MAARTRDELSPAERDEVQMHYLRAWLCRKRRAKFDAVRNAPAKQFRMDGSEKGARRCVVGRAKRAKHTI